MTSDLAAWLLADDGPIAEDEADAHASHQPGRHWAPEDRGVITAWDENDWTQWRPTTTKAISYHIARWDPVRVLAECAAKRAIIAEHDGSTNYGSCPTCADWTLDSALQSPCPTLLALAQPYATHLGWRDEWTTTP